MSNHEPNTRESIDVEPRTERALTEYMTVFPLEGGIFSVTTESGSEYRVDARGGRCTCPDHKHNLPTENGRERCKHRERVAVATGREPLPARLATVLDVDPQLGEHTEGALRLVASDGGIIEAGDDGEILDDDGDDGDRPDECDCADWNTDAGLPCWPCYRDGFEEPASAE